MTKKSSTPAFNAASRVSLEATAVTAMMQAGLNPLIISYSRIFLVATNPSITGIDISVIVNGPTKVVEEFGNEFEAYPSRRRHIVD